MLGGLALVLAVGGVFGVFSYLVEERTRRLASEWRSAPGAPKSLPRCSAAHARPCFAGLAVAAILSFAAGQALRGFLHGLSPLDPVAYVGTAAVLAVAVAATIIPARRAMTVDPVVALRHE